ncbi:hypothetical protein S40285_01872 [Stachybotrys chlorohalonatus IBT 40285]|uniref:Bromodomain associated domain-containing protein n=1 Tax=Stachybotrys chlorohalonatus (strain IBT 40285) TaxID=1283841 RepID=A0A084QQR0_STAC4|nr:hypothetical protein S40285_01872 [Stachybotrys chlorohalonata IBT 40285]
MTTPPSIFHALLRPSILQILRATGYHSTRPAVLDSLTDLAARYLSLLCQGTAAHAAHNHGDSADFTLVDVRLALQDAGALLPGRVLTDEEWSGQEDLRGVEEFIKWFAGQRMKELMEFGRGDGEIDATDYLNALKKKHSKTGDDAKYHGTIIGRGNDVGEVQVEGGRETSINEWILKQAGPVPDEPDDADAQQDAQPSPVSSLSSVDSEPDEPLKMERERDREGDKMDMT